MQADFDIAALPFVPFEDRRHIPHESAVYFVIDSADEVIYVGKSVDIRVRWKTHHLLPLLAKGAGLRIAWLVPERAGRLEEIESEMIRSIRPTLNVIGKPRENPFTAVVNIPFEPDLLERVDDYRFQYRFKSRQAALRHLLTYAVDNINRSRSRPPTPPAE